MHGRSNATVSWVAFVSCSGRVQLGRRSGAGCRSGASRAPFWRRLGALQYVDHLSLSGGALVEATGNAFGREVWPLAIALTQELPPATELPNMLRRVCGAAQTGQVAAYCPMCFTIFSGAHSSALSACLQWANVGELRQLSVSYLGREAATKCENHTPPRASRRTLRNYSGIT